MMGGVMNDRESLVAALRQMWRLWRSDAACAVCGKPERPWRAMLWFALGGPSGAFVCSDECWDRIAQRAA